jgi:hypothetical protein
MPVIHFPQSQGCDLRSAMRKALRIPITELLPVVPLKLTTTEAIGNPALSYLIFAIVAGIIRLE